MRLVLRFESFIFKQKKSVFCGQRLNAFKKLDAYAQKKKCVFCLVLVRRLMIYAQNRRQSKEEVTRTKPWLSVWMESCRRRMSSRGWDVLCVGTSSKNPWCCRVPTASVRNVCRALRSLAGIGVPCAGKTSRKARRSLTVPSATFARPTPGTHLRGSRNPTVWPAVRCTWSRWCFTARRTSSQCVWTVSPCTAPTYCGPSPTPSPSVR